MDASWRPSLRAVSFYPQSSGDQCPARKLVSSDCRIQPTAKPAGLHPTEVARNGRVWGSKKAVSTPQGAAHAAEQMIEFPKKQEDVYDKEALLLLRQLMMDTGAIGEALSANGRLMCIQVSEELPSGKPSKKLSTGSVCSTVDTLSDTSEDHDTTSSCTEIAWAEEPTGVPTSLRAGAPEFVPFASAAASDLAQDVHPPRLLSDSNIESLPLWGEASRDYVPDATVFHGGLGCHVEEPVAKDVLEAASQRYLEWRHYCGLTTVLCDNFPRSFSHFDANRCSVAELFAMAKPGELFVCNQN